MVSIVVGEMRAERARNKHGFTELTMDPEHVVKIDSMGTHHLCMYKDLKRRW